LADADHTDTSSAAKEERFQEILNSIHLFGMEKRFYDLSHLPGPVVPSWMYGTTIYEIYVRAFSREGTFSAVTERLPALKDLGVVGLWLMPVYPIGREGRKGRLGSPYAVRDYFTVNPEYGTEEDFKTLVQEAHRLGLKIILDMVLNHVAPDYQTHEAKGDLFQRDAAGNIRRRMADWSDIADLDYEKDETRRHALQVMRYWIEKFDVDGYRCDVAGMVPLDFWEWAVPQLKAIKPEIFFLAEWENPLQHREAFHATYDWSLFELMKLVHSGGLPARRLAEWIGLKNSVYPKNALYLRFLENHDKERAVTTFGAAMLPFLVFIFTIDGLPLIYNGQEIGADGYLNLFEKEEIDWSQRNERLLLAVKRLIALRRQHAALSSKNYRFEFFAETPALLQMVRGQSKELLIVLNFSRQEVVFSRQEQISSAQVLFNTVSEWDGRRILPFQALIIHLNF